MVLLPRKPEAPVTNNLFILIPLSQVYHVSQSLCYTIVKSILATNYHRKEISHAAHSHL